MNKFFVKNNNICYEDIKIPQNVICNLLNFFENTYIGQAELKPSNHLDFTKYICECCKKEEYGYSGLWNQDPYLFFCSIKCHNIWQEKRMADNNELDYCPICEQDKMVYVGRADSYFCYGCEKWYDSYMIENND